jgi:hypothetical protein
MVSKWRERKKEQKKKKKKSLAVVARDQLLALRERVLELCNGHAEVALRQCHSRWRRHARRLRGPSKQPRGNGCRLQKKQLKRRKTPGKNTKHLN